MATMSLGPAALRDVSDRALASTYRQSRQCAAGARRSVAGSDPGRWTVRRVDGVSRMVIRVRGATRSLASRLSRVVSRQCDLVKISHLPVGAKALPRATIHPSVPGGVIVCRLHLRATRQESSSEQRVVGDRWDWVPALHTAGEFRLRMSRGQKAGSAPGHGEARRTAGAGAGGPFERDMRGAG
jgi:hypothetical protein